MANGPSVPSTEIMVHNVELLDHTHSIDKSLLLPVAEHFEKVGKAAGFLVNQANEYDVRYEGRDLHVGYARGCDLGGCGCGRFEVRRNTAVRCGDDGFWLVTRVQLRRKVSTCQHAQGQVASRRSSSR